VLSRRAPKPDSRVAREDGLRSTVVTLVGVLALVGVGIGAAFALRSSAPAPLAASLSASGVFPGSAASVDSGTQAPSLDDGAQAAATGYEGARPNADGLIYAREYRHWLYEPNTGISFFWQNDATTLYVGLISPGTGWVSVGLGGREDKAGTDTVIGCVRDGKVVLEDYCGVSKAEHRRDRESPFVEAGGTELHGETTLEFAIPLESGDRRVADLVPGGTTRVTLARHGVKDDFAAEQTCCGTTWIPLD